MEDPAGGSKPIARAQPASAPARSASAGSPPGPLPAAGHAHRDAGGLPSNAGQAPSAGELTFPAANGADPISKAGAGGATASRPTEADGAAAPKGRRRKRRRGRKVFARDASPGSGPDGSGARPPEARPADGAAAAGPADDSGRLPAAASQGGRGAAQDLPAQDKGEGGRRPLSQPRRTPRPGDLPAYAALDLGTNNCRLLVAIPGRPGQFRVIDAFSRIVRLGEGLSSTGRLSDAAMERALEALRICADKLASRQVRAARLIATEACRAAANGEEFLARVADRTGLDLEIIDRETEARLAVSGCGPLVEGDTDAVVLFDIGGGSSEIALVDLSRQRTPRLASHIVSWTSLPVGVVSLAERFGGRDVSREKFAAMVADVEAMIGRYDGRGRLGALASGARFHLLGTSGTVTTLAGVHLGLERYDRRQVDGLWMGGGEIDAMIEKLLSWDFDARMANPCIGADRADLVLAGCAILEAIRRTWPSERLRVADRGLREGILSDLMDRDGAWRRPKRRNGWAGRR